MLDLTFLFITNHDLYLMHIGMVQRELTILRRNDFNDRTFKDPKDKSEYTTLLQIRKKIEPAVWLDDERERMQKRSVVFSETEQKVAACAIHHAYNNGIFTVPVSIPELKLQRAPNDPFVLPKFCRN